jgi:hypothetical protein
LCAVGARADERLSDRGRWLVQGALGYAWSNADARSDAVRMASREAWLSPSLIYFFRDHVGVGGYAGYLFRRELFNTHEVTWHAGGIGVQAAFELPIERRLGLLFLPALGYQRQRYAADQATYWASQDPIWQQPSRAVQVRGRYDAVELRLFAPLVFHATSSLGLGLGPSLSAEVYLHPRDGAGRFVHLRVGVMSWIGATF